MSDKASDSFSETKLEAGQVGVSAVEHPPVSYEKGSRWQEFKDSFRRVEFSREEYETLTPLERAALATANSPLQRSLKGRHLQMIAIGGAIGTGLFIGSGRALSTGGPASLLIGYGLIGAMLYCTVQALGELSIAFPVSGGFSVFSTRFIHPSWGFAMGWNYSLLWLTVFPLELIAATLTVQYWNDRINPVAWVVIFYIFILVVNLFGVKGYGEAEFIFSSIKVLAVIGFVILGIVLNCGGGPEGGYIGGKYWHDPGAFNHGFKGLCAVFVTGAFSFTGTELVGLAAAETANPRKTLPSAIKQVFWRITLFYMVSLTIVGLLVPYDDPQLLGDSSVDITASPFVIAIKRAGIKALPSIFNVVILVAVLSVGNSAVYGCSRTLAALSAQGYAPGFLGYIDRKGRPLGGIAASALVGVLCFVAASPVRTKVFSWLMSFTGLSSIFTWGSICACHIRFRMALLKKGRTTKELSYRSQVGIYGSYFGLVFNFLVLVAQFWTGLFPIGGNGADAESFFQAYLVAPIILALFLFWLIWKRQPFITLDSMDIDTGRRDVDLVALTEELEIERAELAARPFWYRTYKFWC